MERLYAKEKQTAIKMVFLYMKISFVLLMLFVSCAGNPLEGRTVELEIVGKNRWEEKWNAPVWYRLSLSDGREIHLDGDQRSIQVFVPYGKTVYAVAYPLGSSVPLGAAVTTETKTSVLNQSDGRMAEYFSDISATYRETLSYLDYPLLKKGIGEKGVDLLDLDLPRLTSALLNNDPIDPSIIALPIQSVKITALPQGRWIPDREEDETFWFDGENPVILRLHDGVHSFYCREKELLFRIFVDARKGESYQSLRQFPFWGE